MQSPFAQFLLQNEYASLAELEEASQATVLYGGRLGTSLIELGILTPEQLDAALARHHGLPELPREWLARPDAAARAALHVDLIKRHRAFPLHFEKRSLHVGMVDPRDEAVLDTLAFASGCLVVPYALPEFRFVELMQRVYGVAPSPRFRMLLDESRRASALRGREEQRKRAAEQARMEREPSPELASLPAGEELSASDALLPAPMAAAEAEPTERPLLEVDPEPLLLDRRAPSPTLEALERALAGSDARGKLIDTALALACRFAHLAALFVVRDDYASGLAARRGDEALGIDRIVLPLAAQDGLLARCLSTREAQRGLPSSGLDRALAKSLRSTPDTELAVFAVAIGGRVVNLLVAQAASGALGGTAAAALGALAPQIGAAYERLIRAQKQKARAGVASPAKRPREKAAIGALPLQKRVVRVPAPKP